MSRSNLRIQERDWGLDLLRIVCMMMVVGIHTFGWGGLIENALVPESGNWFIGNTAYAMLLQAVNCFILISGYFLCTARFRLSKLASVWAQAAFYSVGVYIVICLLGGEVFSLKELVKCGLVVTMDRYWFVTDYILLFCVSPFLNCAIRAMNQRLHLVCCCALIIIFSILPNLIYIVDFSGVNGGYSLTWFCVLYIIAAYLRLYVPKKVKRQKLMPALYLILSLVICGERFAAHFITPYFFGRVVLNCFFYSYNSIVSLPCALALFQSFRGFEIKSGWFQKAIKHTAPLTFAVYLIHEQDHFRPILWDFLNPGAYAETAWMLPYCLLCIAGIFTACCLIDWVRKQLFRICGIDRLIASCCDRVQERANALLKLSE